jgi:DNA modification methylase
MLTILCGDALTKLRELADESVQCCVTSPPYWGLRDYGQEGQLGLEKTPEEYVTRMVTVFREVHRVLRKDGTLWLNLGDSYAGSWGNYGGQNRGNGSQREITTGSHAPQKSYNGLERWKPPTASCGSRIGSKHGDSGHTSGCTPPPGLKAKDLCGIPWRVAFALQADGWYLRQDIIWAKPNPMPESVTDRCTKSHEYLFLITKSARYFYDAEAIQEKAAYDGRNDTLLKPSEKYSSRNIRNDGAVNTLSEIGGQRWRRKNDGTDHGGNGTGFQDHSGYDKLNHPYVRNKRSVWTVTTQSYPDAHFATYPSDLIKPCIMAGTRAGDTVLDPFAGSGTTGMVSIELGRQAILIELNPKYVELIEQRCDVTPGLPL